MAKEKATTMKLHELKKLWEEQVLAVTHVESYNVLKQLASDFSIDFSEAACFVSKEVEDERKFNVATKKDN